MKRILSLLGIAAFCCISAGAAAQVDTVGLKSRLEKHVYYLASDELQGRKAGSGNALEAAKYIYKEWQDMGLRPLDGDYTHAFSRGDMQFRNLIGVIEGKDEALKNEIILIGAHYDHLGVRRGNIYPGADDNASGVAAVTEVARMLLEREGELARTVYIVAFDGEELGLYGSNFLAGQLEDENVVLMLSVDMVGWYKANDALNLAGSGTIKGGDALLKSVADKNGIKLKIKKFENSILTTTDTQGFAFQERPTLAVTTGLKSPYHKPQDTADKIDYDGLAAVSCYLADLVCEVASEPGYQPSGKVAGIHRRSRDGFAVSVGFGPSSLDFGKKSGLMGKSYTSYRIGVDYTKGFMDLFAVRGGVEYGYNQVLIPDMNAPFTSTASTDFHHFDVPVELLYDWVSVDEARMYVGVGVYYRYAFGNPDVLRSGWGEHISIGFAAGPVTMEWRMKYPFSSLFAEGSQLAAKYGMPANAFLKDNFFCFSIRF